MYKYETHSHTFPVSQCAHASVYETVEFYKSLGYDGIFITNHFLDGNISINKNDTYENKINFHYSDYEQAAEYGRQLGIKVFAGAEVSYRGTDFLVYGLDKSWFLAHPETEAMKMSEKLRVFAENGAFIVQAHPFREAAYIDHIRLFPRLIHGAEVINANRTDFENSMAKTYAESYNLCHFAGSDNHLGKNQPNLAGMQSERPIADEKDFISAAKAGELEIFTLKP